MARDTAEFSSRHQDEQEDRVDENLSGRALLKYQADWPPSTAHEQALASFKERLETLDPTLRSHFEDALTNPADHRDLHGHIRSDLTGPVTYSTLQPLLQDENTNYPPWLDPSTALESLAEINLAFRENTASLHHEEKAWVAHQVATALTAPMTHPVKDFKDRYLALEDQGVNEPIISDILGAAQAFSDQMDDYRDTLTGALQMDNLQMETHRGILEQMDHAAATGNSQMATHLMESIEHRTAGMDDEETSQYHRALTHILAAPLHTRASSAIESYANPIPETPGTSETDRFSPEWMENRTLRELRDLVHQDRANTIHDLRASAEIITESMSQSLDEGTINQVEFTRDLSSLQDLHSALDFENSHSANAQHLAYAVHELAVDTSLPGRTAIADYAARALSGPTQATLDSYHEDNSPERYMQRGIPHHEHFYMMTQAAASGAHREHSRLSSKLGDDLDYGATPDVLANDLQAMASLPAVLEVVEQTGEAPDFLDEDDAADFTHAANERTNFMLRDMEQHLLREQPDIFREQNQSWAERLQHPALINSMSQYNRDLPPSDQRRLAHEVIRRSQEPEQDS